MQLNTALVVVAAAVSCGAGLAQAPRSTVDPRLGRYFGAYTGCLVLRDLGTDETVRVNPEQCARRLPPCSTFKIWHAMAGLETGVLKDETTTFAWDGTKYPVPAWNHDHTLATAIRDSVVWYFQRVAEAIGERRMSFWMNEVPYGNGDRSGGLTSFWLDGSLRISAEEQVWFLQQMYTGKLKFRPEVVEVVKKLIVVRSGDGFELAGKTGSCNDEGRGLGWFVGHLKSTRGEYVFALNVEGNAKADGREARRILAEILEQRRLLPPEGDKP